MKLYAQTIIILVAICLCPALLRAQSPSTVIKFDLDRDGRRETISLDSEKDPTLNVRHGRKLLWQGVHASWKPWKLMGADVDGDGEGEIIVGGYKATRYFPPP